MMNGFEQQLLLFNPCVIRSATFRKDMNLAIIQQPGPSQAPIYIDWVAEKILEYTQPRDRHSRFIIYTSLTNQAEQLATTLGCEYYYGQADHTYKTAAFTY
jgi:hypothetical protein